MDKLEKSESSENEIQSSDGEEEEAIVEKIILRGCENVGKTSILLNFLFKKFFKTVEPTSGVEVLEKEISKDNINIILELWDTSGKEEDKNLISTFYDQTKFFIFVFDLTNKSSFEKLNSYFEEINKYSNIIKHEDVFVYVIGNKSDLKDDKKVSQNDIENFLKSHQVFYQETSTLENDNKSINIVFDDIIGKIYEAEIKYLNEIGKEQEKHKMEIE